MSSAGVAWETKIDHRGAERARDFRFDVTWSALTAHLEPLQTAEQIFSAAPAPLPVRAPAPVPTLDPVEVILFSASASTELTPVEKRPAPKLNFQPESAPRWEMVVPKMDRPAARKAAPPRRALSTAPEPLLARAVTAISGRRELLLAKIVRTALGRLKPAELTLPVPAEGKRAGIL